VCCSISLGLLGINYGWHTQMPSLPAPSAAFVLCLCVMCLFLFAGGFASKDAVLMARAYPYYVYPVGLPRHVHVPQPVGSNKAPGPAPSTNPQHQLPHYAPQRVGKTTNWQ